MKPVIPSTLYSVTANAILVSDVRLVGVHPETAICYVAKVKERILVVYLEFGQMYIRLAIETQTHSFYWDFLRHT